MSPAARVFMPPEAGTGTYGGLQQVGLRLQFALAATGVAAIWIAPGLTLNERVAVSLMMVLFVGYTVLSAKACLGSPIIRLISFPTDLLALFSFAFVVPATLPLVLFAAMLTITFHTCTCGRAAGLWLAAVVVALVVAADAVTAASVEPFVVVIYGLILVVLTLMIDGLAAERRRQANHLARLHRALRMMSAEPELQATLNAITAAVKDAVDAAFVVVMMRGDQRLEVSAADGVEVRPGDGENQRRLALDPTLSPSGAALASGAAVVVRDFDTDDRFSHWADEVKKHGIGSLVVAPLGPPNATVGVLNTYFANKGACSAEDLDLIVAYAQQASIPVARAMAYEQQRLATERLTEADRLKSEFVSTVSHELRTPLTAVRGFVATVLSRWDNLSDHERQNLLQRADWNARELNELIEQVLDFSRLEAGVDRVTLEEIDLGHMVAALLDRLGPALGERRLELQAPPGVRVMANEAGLGRVVTNLLTNAAKFSPTGSTITVRVRVDGGEVITSVQDEGPGIAPSERDRVFERFYRAAPTAGQRGTGIGLAIVRSYVERLGGRVWVEDTAADEGACFSFALTAAPTRDRSAVG